MIEIMQIKEQRERRIRKNEQSLWDAIKYTNMCAKEVPDKRKEKEAEKILEDTWLKTSQIWWKPLIHTSTPTKQEMWVQSLGWEDPLEKEVATHFSVLSGKSHGQWSLVGYRSKGIAKELDTT